jgi:DNA-binding NarL/FixJ family response regulator
LTDSSMQKEEYNIYIIGNKRMFNELLVYFLEHSTNQPFKCSLNSSYLLLNLKKTKGSRNLVLCNCQDMHEQDASYECGRHIAAIPSDCYWACINVPYGKKMAESAISNGSHGIFYENDTPAFLTKGIKAIFNGELWFSRDTMSATLSSLVEKNIYKSSQDVSDRVDLTRREKEVLLLIALGKTNEDIAEKLNISALTVKTHVSNIYRKINVPNRIQAIFWTTKNVVRLKD